MAVPRVNCALPSSMPCSSTSIHLCDHTAQNYINGICDDLGTKYTGPFSAEMYDLPREKEQQRLLGFARLFRDEIWGRLRPTFQADHRFYRKHGMYDFPQTDYGMRLLVAVLMILSKLPAFRKEYARRTMPEMVRPLQKVVARA